MCFERLPSVFTQTRVAVLDDKGHQVATLVEFLRQHNYGVEVFNDGDRFLEAIKIRVYPIQLIDISLSEGDTVGLQVAGKAAQADPHALRICISQNLDDISASSIVPFLNARMHGKDMPLSLSDALGVRDLWAMHDKKKDGADLLRLITDYRMMIGCGDAAVIEADSELQQDFRTSFSGIRWDDATHRQEPQVQFVEIVRQLARRAGQPEVSRIRLRKIGKGRSKTVVAHMSVAFRTDGNTGAKSEFTVERRQIIKVGRMESIAREVRNYTNHVPRLFSSVFCPTIEAVGCCRTLAGLAYSRISDSRNQDAAPTLLEALYGTTETVNPNEAKRAFDDVFSFRVSKDFEVRPDQNGRLLFPAYQKRFNALQVQRDRVTGRPTLDELLEQANDRLQAAAVIQEQHGAYRFVGGRNGPVPVADSINDLVKDYAQWEGFYSALCHGDLHLDNVLLVRQGKSLVNVYIDFADVDWLHTVMDYVVMEVALRFQSLRFLLDTISGDELQRQESKLLKVLANLEFAILAGKTRWRGSAALLDGLPQPTQEWLRRTSGLILDVRKQSREFVDQDLYGAMKRYWSRELPEAEDVESHVQSELGKERQRYACGLGLASLAAMDLRQPDEIRALHECWFALVGQLLMRRFNEWKQRGLPQ